MTNDDIITAVLQREGGSYTDRPADHGGPTKWGITQASLASYRGAAVTPAEVEGLSADDARALYAELYLHRPGFAGIADARLRGLVVDCGVLHGTGEAAKWLQAAAKVKGDGVLGAVSLAAINAADPARLYGATLAARLVFLGRLITRDPSQAPFAAGWLARAAAFADG